MKKTQLFVAESDAAVGRVREPRRHVGRQVALVAPQVLPRVAASIARTWLPAVEVNITPSTTIGGASWPSAYEPVEIVQAGVRAGPRSAWWDLLQRAVAPAVIGPAVERPVAVLGPFQTFVADRPVILESCRGTRTTTGWEWRRRLLRAVDGNTQPEDEKGRRLRRVACARRSCGGLLPDCGDSDRDPWFVSHAESLLGRAPACILFVERLR